MIGACLRFFSFSQRNKPGRFVTRDSILPSETAFIGKPGSTLSVKTVHVPLFLLLLPSMKKVFTSVGTQYALGLFSFSKAPDTFHKGDMAWQVSYTHSHNTTPQQPPSQANLALCLRARRTVAHASSCLCVAAGASAGCKAHTPAAGWR